MSEKTAKASLKNESISTKFSVELCRHIRHKRLSVAKSFLQDVIAMRKPLPLLKHNKKKAHKRGPVAGGRFPVKASKSFAILLDSVESNAQQKGLNADDLIITHASAHIASRPFHPGRHRGRLMKRSHVNIVVEEKVQKKKVKKEAKKEVSKPGLKDEKKIEASTASVEVEVTDTATHKVEMKKNEKSKTEGVKSEKAPIKKSQEQQTEETPKTEKQPEQKMVNEAKV